MMPSFHSLFFFLTFVSDTAGREFAERDGSLIVGPWHASIAGLAVIRTNFIPLALRHRGALPCARGWPEVAVAAGAVRLLAP